MSNVIKVAFGGRYSQSKYFEIDADEPHQPVIVSVHPEGVELLQYEDGELSEIYITDTQLSHILALMISSDEEDDINVH